MIKLIRNLSQGRNSLKVASIILIITLFLSNVLGVLRNYFISHNLPVQSTDIYYAAFRIPDLVLNLMILGAVSSALMPVFNGYLQKDDKKGAWHVANSIITLALIILTSSIVILFFLMPYIIHLIVPHFGPEETRQTIKIARILLLSPLLFGISYLFSGILNSFQRFFAPAVAPLIYNASIIVGAGVLAPLFPLGDSRQIILLASSVIFGAFLHMLIQLPAMRHVGFHFHWIADYKNKAVRQIGKLMIPRTIGLGSNQIMFTVFTALASATRGHISYFSYANDIQTMPSVVFGLSFATAVFPSLSTAFHQEDDSKFTYYLSKTMKLVIALLIPLSALFILLRVGIVQALLGFSLHDSKVTADTLALFSISLVFSGLIPLLARAFFAMENTVTPTIISVISSISSIVVAYLLRSHGAPGLALAFSFGSILNASLLYVTLRRKYKGINERKLILFTLKVVLMVIIMSLVVQAFKGATSDWFNVKDTRLGMFAQVIICGGVGAVLYIMMAQIFKVQEVQALWRRGGKN
ncbi:MAG: murein biosynthesis integral membrane protein MurJ [bacterium]|nr:murein biosynthesis integral membrane protein MurJ [bacterium]